MILPALVMITSSRSPAGGRLSARRHQNAGVLVHGFGAVGAQDQIDHHIGRHHQREGGRHIGEGDAPALLLGEARENRQQRLCVGLKLGS
jgi:hypothetical protein